MIFILYNKALFSCIETKIFKRDRLMFSKPTNIKLVDFLPSIKVISGYKTVLKNIKIPRNNNNL